MKKLTKLLASFALGTVLGTGIVFLKNETNTFYDNLRAGVYTGMAFTAITGISQINRRRLGCPDIYPNENRGYKRITDPEEADQDNLRRLGLTKEIRKEQIRSNPNGPLARDHYTAQPVNSDLYDDPRW